VAGASTVHLAADAEGRWHLEPFGWVVEPAGLAAQELADLGALLADALAAPVDLDGAVDPTGSPSAAPPPTAPERTLLVRLLGPVDVVDATGRAAAFSRSKSLELVVWLAEHRANPSRRAARTALWAADVRDATFANVVSEARRALAAVVPGGEEWISRTGGDRLLLHPGVSTDAELLAAAVASARRLDGAEAVDAFRDGLALVRTFRSAVPTTSGLMAKRCRPTWWCWSPRPPLRWPLVASRSTMRPARSGRRRKA
jgi:hypothetical protein